MMLFPTLVFVHFLCDFPLQGDFLARAKNHRNPVAGVSWLLCLFAHSVIQAGGVFLVTHSVVLSCAELIVHMTIDWMKSEGLFGFTFDQGLHVICKALWAVILAAAVV